MGLLAGSKPVNPIGPLQIMAKTVENGVHYGMTDEDYFAAPGISQSTLSGILNSKKRAANKRALLIGSATDILVFDGPSRWDELYTVSAEEHKLNTKAGKQAVAEIAEKTGKEVLRPSEWQIVGGMYESLKRHGEATWHLVGGHGSSQACVFADLMGLQCKGKLDRIVTTDPKRPYAVDLKTSGCLNHIQFEQSVTKFWYDSQAAMYSDLWEAATGLLPWQFVNVCVSKEWPHPVWIRQYSEEQIAVGRRQYQSMLAAWSKWNATTD